MYILSTKVFSIPPTRCDKFFPSLFSVQGKIKDYRPKNVGFTNNILENDKNTKSKGKIMKCS